MLIPHLLLRETPLCRIPGGERLIEEGTAGTKAFVLAEGEVRIDICGREIIYISDRGALFGEMAALLGRPRGATVTAVKDSDFFVIEDFLSFVRQDPELSMIMLRLLAQRIDEMNNLATERRKWWQVF